MQAQFHVAVARADRVECFVHEVGQQGRIAFVGAAEQAAGDARGQSVIASATSTSSARADA
jgi:hypothetical protein